MASILSQQERGVLVEGVAAFNRGDYYAAHDLFESLWGEDFFKGLVQAAVALHHWSVGNLRGIEGLPENVPRVLERYRPVHHGIDVDGFLEAFGGFMREIQSGQGPGRDEAPRLAWSDQSSPMSKSGP